MKYVIVIGCLLLLTGMSPAQDRAGRILRLGSDGRRQLLECIDSAAWLGLDSNYYQPGLLRSLEGVTDGDADRRFTAAAFDLAADIFRGRGVEKMLSYDGVSPGFASRDEDRLWTVLTSADPAHLREMFGGLEPATQEYLVLKAALGRTLGKASGDTIARLSTALNMIRWVHHFHFDRFIVVNIPSATLRFHTGDTVGLQMRIVAGQTSKRTPRFAGWVDGVVLYPYWNIPRHIATHELLPLFKRSPGLAVLMQIQVLDERGRKLDPAMVQWARYSATSFPYTLRQAPGCENALGVLKFNISSPFDVYMHDTNLKHAFGSSWRFLSHGCIRLEKPFALGDLLMDHHLDTVVLNSCLRDQQPVPVSLHPPVPVFVLYNTVLAAPDGSILWFKDIYHLLP